MGTGEDEPGAALCRVLIERLRSLEASYERLRNQFRYATSVGVRVTLADRDVTADVGLGYLKYYNLKNPYRSILDSMGHALYVSSPDSHEIIYWNLPASKLYGWNDYEVIGERVTDLLIDEEFYGAFNKIMEELRAGKSWSGQFPLKKRSGKIFMAIVTKSPLYEGGELTGIVTVSSDDSVHNSMNSRANLRAYQGRGNAQSSLLGSDLKRIQRHAHPQIAIASVPQIASSVSNLTSKVLPSKPGNSSCQVAGNGDSEQTPPKIKDTSDNFRTFVGKVLSKFHVGRSGNSDGRRDGNGHLNGSVDTSVSRESRSEENVLQDSKIAPIYYDSILKETRENALESKLNSKAQDVQRYETPSRSPVLVSKECPECFSQPTLEYIASHGSHFGLSDSKPLVEDLKAEAVEHLVRRPPDVKKDPSFGELISNGDEGDDESNAKIDYEICWEDLKVGEQLGQGSCAIVHRGIWNGSDVAIKVFLGYDCHEGTLADYRKEINIMRRLRHPNVLLYMGAVSSQERLAIVTEYLPRGSLFKTIHKNSPGLDIKRHLRMALDAAKGMNYLHCRNPPIVHRDLKTSNLLVGKNWTVKVGDFGLSKMKHTTFLTAKSGRGTPQWMAPEVLRNEPSNEKSDVFSFGVILWELMTQSIPWGNLNALQVVGVVGFMDRRLQLPEDIDPQISSLISECWQSDPQKRPSFQEIIKIMVRVIRRFASTTQTESEP